MGEGMKIVGHSFMGTIRRLHFAIGEWLWPKDEAPAPDLTVMPIRLYPMPKGFQWRPLWDFELNNRLDERGLGWRSEEAIEVWRENWPRPSFVFTQSLAAQPAVDATGLWWRPLPHGRWSWRA